MLLSHRETRGTKRQMLSNDKRTTNNDTKKGSNASISSSLGEYYRTLLGHSYRIMKDSIPNGALQRQRQDPNESITVSVLWIKEKDDTVSVALEAIGCDIRTTKANDEWEDTPKDLDRSIGKQNFL